jgi:hypothetical protein
MGMIAVCDGVLRQVLNGTYRRVECSVAWRYVDENANSILPNLTVAEGVKIATAIVLLWAVAWAGRQILKTIK